MVGTQVYHELFYEAWLVFVFCRCGDRFDLRGPGVTRVKTIKKTRLSEKRGEALVVCFFVLHVCGVGQVSEGLCKFFSRNQEGVVPVLRWAPVVHRLHGGTRLFDGMRSDGADMTGSLNGELFD